MKKVFSIVFALFLLVAVTSLVGCNGLWNFDDDDDVVATPTNYTVSGSVSTAAVANIKAQITTANTLKALAYRVKADGTEEAVDGKEFDVNGVTGNYEVQFSSFPGYFFIRIISKDPALSANFEMISLLGNLTAADTTKTGVNVDARTTAKALIRRLEKSTKAPTEISDAEAASIETQIETILTTPGNTGDLSTITVPATSFTVNPTSVSLEINQTTNLSATITPSYSTDSVKWEIKSGGDFITLSGATVTGKAEGSAVITATVGTLTVVEIPVTVSKVAVQSVAISKGQVSELEIGQTSNLEATLSPTGAEGVVVWTSSDNTKVEVTSTGNLTATIKAIAESTQVTITATVGGKSASFNLAVKKATIKPVSLNKDVVGIQAGSLRIVIENVTSSTQITASIAGSKADSDGTTYNYVYKNSATSGNATLSLDTDALGVRMDALGLEGLDRLSYALKTLATFNSILFSENLPAEAVVKVYSAEDLTTPIATSSTN